jgi:malonyl-CoA decarboxylase
MNAMSWISRQVQHLMPHHKTAEISLPDAAPTRLAANPRPADVHPDTERSTKERLLATMRRRDEALSPRMLRRTLDELRAIIDPQISDVEGGRRAQELSQLYLRASVARRRDLWLLMSEQFMADPVKVRAAQAKFAAQVGTPDEAAAEVEYRRSTVSPRRRLLQRFSVIPEGIRFLVEMRADMQPFVHQDKRLQALDIEMEYLFSTWFDVGFLELQRMSWDSPASLVEKLIKYEAVHDIRSWADVKNRLDSDRRCYGFFHPRLPGEPLIFVEVALIDHMAHSITPLLDELAEASDLSRATTAIFYSISNTQPGLRGVSFGDSLIKRVAETLSKEFPKLRTFATLSPIPGFRTWLSQNATRMLEQTPEKLRAELGRAVSFEPPTARHVLEALNHQFAQLETLDADAPFKLWLMQCVACYLGQEMHKGRPVDSVARFHLGNGARIERLNWLADPSPKGLKQSYGIMVNYLYDLKKIDKHRHMLLEGEIPISSEVGRLLS